MLLTTQRQCVNVTILVVPCLGVMNYFSWQTESHRVCQCVASYCKVCFVVWLFVIKVARNLVKVSRKWYYKKNKNHHMCRILHFLLFHCNDWNTPTKQSPYMEILLLNLLTAKFVEASINCFCNL